MVQPPSPILLGALSTTRAQPLRLTRGITLEHYIVYTHNQLYLGTPYISKLK